MRIAAMLLLITVVQPALAMEPSPQAESSSAGPDLWVVTTAFRMRAAFGASSLSALPVESRSSILTSDYWSRAYEQRAQLEARFGIRLSHGLTFDPYAIEQEPMAGPGHQPFGFGEMRWNVKPQAGFQFKRENFLLKGDRLTFRSNSDIQAVFREVGLFKSDAEVDALSLLGWRSHSQLLWQIGEPTREIQWQFSARFDRRAYAQTSTVGFNLLRRF